MIAKQDIEREVESNKIKLKDLYYQYQHVLLNNPRSNNRILCEKEIKILEEEIAIQNYCIEHYDEIQKVVSN